MEAPRTPLLALILCLCLFLPSHLAGQQCFTDCMYTCTTSHRCDASCTSNCDTQSSCGEYGVCNPDPDGDVWIADNCPYTYNPDQADCDGDLIGDACDSVNGSYVAVGDWELCHIVGRSHLGFSDVAGQYEKRWTDQSSCGSPDKWTLLNGEKHDCLQAVWSCCLLHWDAPTCLHYLNINHCQV